MDRQTIWYIGLALMLIVVVIIVWRARHHSWDRKYKRQIREARERRAAKDAESAPD